MALIQSIAIGGQLNGGAGYVAGELPDGIVTVNGAPAPRRVDLIHRATCQLIASRFSTADGTYRFDGLDPAEEFDIIGRDWTSTYNDTITSRVRPEPYAIQSLTGALVANNAAKTLDGAVDIYGGEAHLVTIKSGTPPPGLDFAVAVGGPPTFDRVGRWLTSVGTTFTGDYVWTLLITAADGSSIELECSATYT